MRVWGVQKEEWVCAPHLLPSPNAARFIYMFIALRRHIHFYGLRFQVYLYTPEQTPNLPGRAHALQTPLVASSDFHVVSEGWEK